MKLIIFDQISSTPSVRFEIERMIEYFRQENLLTLIDGAHPIGIIQINLTDFNLDFYLLNNDKWSSFINISLCEKESSIISRSILFVGNERFECISHH